MGQYEEDTPWYKGTNFRIAALAIAIMGIGYTMYATYSHYTGGLPPLRTETSGTMERRGGPDGPGRSGPPSAADRQQRMQEMAKELNLTPEQQKQMEERMKNMPKPGQGAPPAGGGPMGQGGPMSGILTQEQQQKFQQNMQQRMQQRQSQMKQRLQGHMSPTDIQALDERMKNMPQRGGRGGGPPGPPPQ